MQTIHLFVKDTSFVNKSVQVSPVLGVDGAGILSSALLANYLNPTEIRDPRGARLSGLQLPMQSTMSLITDAATSVSSFVSDYQSVWSSPDMSQLFNLVDQICFNFRSGTTSTAVDASLATNLSLFGIYESGSLSYSTASENANVYLTSTPDTILIPKNAQFKIKLTDVGSTALEYIVVVWMDGSYFEANYPVSNITAVVPPLTYTDLLNKSLTTMSDNALVIAKESSQTSLSDLTNPLSMTSTVSAITDGVTGYLPYEAKVVDGNGNYIFMPFNIVYKGRAPGILPIREAIRAAILASNTGTQAQWQARIPELFINAQFYLLPQWKNTTVLPNSTIYPDITPVATLITQAEEVFFDMPTSFVTGNLQSMTSIYDGITLAVIPDQANPTNRVSLLGEHPTYQALATTDPNFAYMAANTKQFATNLANALPVASGLSTSNAYAVLSIDQPTSTLQRNFVTFTVADVEYFILTSETLSNVLANPPGNSNS